MMPRMAPVRRHLTSAGGRVGRRAHSLQEHFVGRHSQGEAKGAIAVVRVDPVFARMQYQARRHLDGFMAGAADLKENAVLAFQRHLAVVQAPRGVHDAEGADELLRIQSGEPACRRGFRRTRRDHPGPELLFSSVNESEFAEARKVYIQRYRAYTRPAHLAALIACPTWRCVCSAMWVNRPATVVGSCFLPTLRGSVRRAGSKARTTASAS